MCRSSYHPETEVKGEENRKTFTKLRKRGTTTPLSSEWNRDWLPRSRLVKRISRGGLGRRFSLRVLQSGEPAVSRAISGIGCVNKAPFARGETDTSRDRDIPRCKRVRDVTVYGKCESGHATRVGVVALTADLTLSIFRLSGIRWFFAQHV